MEDKSLQQYRKKLVAEAVIKSCVFGFSAGLAVSLIIALASYLAYFTYGFIIAFGSLPVVTAATALILYKKMFSVSAKQVASRVDRMGLEERIVTASEYGDSDLFIIQKLKLDAKEKLGTVTPKTMRFAFSKWIFVLLGIVFAFSTTAMAFSTARGVNAMNRLDTPSGFKYVKKEITWREVTGAKSGYHFVITAESGIVMEDDTRLAKVRVSDLEPGSYFITAFAKKSTNRSQSAVSAPFRFLVKTNDQEARDQIIEELLAALRAAIEKSDAEQYIKDELYGAVNTLEESIYEKDTALDLAAKVNGAAERIRLILNGAVTTTIVFESNNGRNENVSMRKKPPEKNLNGTLQRIIDVALNSLDYPRTDETFEIGAIPGAPLTAPADKAFMGWAIKGSETILKDREIVAAIGGGEYSFSAIWLTEEEIIQRLLSELRAIINAAKIYEDQRAALHIIVNTLEAELNGLQTLSDKILKIGATKGIILGMIESFKITVFFDPNNGINGVITVRKLPLEFDEKSIPKAPKTVPAEGMAFAGWAVDDGSEEPTVLETAEIIQAILGGERNFIAVWFYPEVVDPDEDGDEPEEPSEDEPTEADISDVIDDALDALEELKNSETDGGGAMPGENEYRGDEVLDGKTPYTDVKGWYESMAELLASSNLPPALREIIERYFDTLK